MPETLRRGDNRLPLARMLAAAAFLVLLIAAVHRASPRTLISAHGLLHSAIAQRLVSDPLTIPPENPFFAGESIRYYWFFHAAGAAVSRLLGLDPLHSFELLIAAGAVAMIFFTTGLARSLYGKATVGFAIGYLVLAGAQPQAPLLLGWRLIRNGTGLLADDPDFLWGIVHPLYRHMRLWDEFGTLGPLLNYFFNITARPLALVTLVGVIWALQRVLSRGGTGRAVILAAGVALLSSLNCLMGIGSVGALTVGLIAGELLRRGKLPDDDAGPDPCLKPALLAMGTGLLIGASTFWQLFETSAPGITIPSPGEAFDQLRGMAAAAWLLLLLALVALSTLRGMARYVGIALTISALIQMIVSTLVQLPVGNQDNFYHAGLVMLAVPAAAIVMTGSGRVGGARALALFLVFLPPATLVIWAYTGRPAAAIRPLHGRLVRVPAESDASRMYEWISTSTPDDAVMILDPGPPTRAAAGNTAELPALTGRSLFTERASHYIVAAYEDAPRRELMSRRLAAGQALSVEDQRYLSGLGRELFIVVARSSEQQGAALRGRYGTPAFESGTLAVYRWRESGTDDP